MSQHYFTLSYKARPVQLLMGWDRPLQGYFMILQYLDNQKYFWSNLDQAVSHPKSLAPFLKVLADFEMYIPLEMIREIESDGLKNVGNKEVHHKIDASGQYSQTGR